jgi:hypothetical protein
MLEVWGVEKVAVWIQQHNVFLHYDERLGVDLWTPHAPVAPLAVRRSVYVHREQLLAMMRAGDTRVCSSPKLHKHSWKKAGPGRSVCEMCLQLDSSGYVEGNKTA